MRQVTKSKRTGERGDMGYEVGQTDSLARKGGCGARWSLDTREAEGSCRLVILHFLKLIRGLEN